MPRNQEDWDGVVKRSVYARYGVPEYLIVNPPSRTVELLSRDQHDLRTLGVYGVHEVMRSVALPGFSMDFGTLFAGLEG